MTVRRPPKGGTPNGRPRLETLFEQVRGFYEERAAVALKARFELSCVRVTSVVAQVVAIADVERRAGFWRPAENDLRAKAF